MQNKQAYMQVSTKSVFKCDILKSHNKIVYHKSFLIFSRPISFYSLGKYIKLLNNTPCRCCHNPSFNATFVEGYEERIVKENYLVGIAPPYLNLFILLT
jgi:hypothetical protein